jgi:autotransporter-associated beta strand protein
LAVAASLALPRVGFTADVIKANNSDALGLGTSWAGGVPPTAADVGVWNSTVTGANTAVLGGDLSWQGIRIANPTGAVTISAGNTLTLGTAGIDMASATQNLSIASGLTVGTTQAWNVASGRTLSVSGAVDGSGPLTKNGTGTLALTSASNSFSGGLTVNAGAITAVGGGLGSGTVSVTAASAFNVSGTAATFANNFSIGSFAGNWTLATPNTSSTVINGTISGGGASTVLFFQGGASGNTGALTLNGTNTFAGTINVQRGPLILGNSSAAGTATILLDSNSPPAGALQLGNFTIANNLRLLSGASVGVAAGNSATISGAISTVSGTNPFIKVGGGVLTLTGTNTYVGITQVNAGVLSISTTAALPGWNTAARTSVAAGATLAVGNAIADADVTTLSTATTFAAGSFLGYDTSAGDRAVSTAVAGTTYGLAKVSANTLTLTGSNTYAGATAVNAGTLQIGSGGTVGTIPATAVTIASGATLAVNRSDAITVGGAISGAGSLRKSGAATLTLSGTNSFAGGTTWEAGSISIASGSGLGTGTVTLTGTAARTLTVANTAAQTFAPAIVLPAPASATSYTIVKNSSGQTTGTNLDLAGIISGGGPNATLFLNSSQGGDSTTSYTLSGANTFRGRINVNRGVLIVGNASGLGDPANLVRLDANANTTLGNLRFTLPMTVPNPIELVATYPINTNEHAVTAGGVVSGGGALRKLGTGTLSLTAANTYTGGTIIDAGTLTIGSGGTAGSISGNVTNNATLAFNRSDAISFSGLIGGSGSVRQLAAGTTTLTAANTYAGGTFVEAGTLALGAAAGLASSSVIVSPGATFDVSALGGGFTRGSGQTLGGSGTVAGAVTIGAGGTLSPGMSPGTLTTGPLTWQAGGNYNWQILSTAGTAGSQWDLISADSLALSGLSAETPFAINLWSLAATGPDVNGPVADFNAAAAGSWRIVNTAAAITGFDPAHFTFSTAAANGTGGFANSLLGGSFSVALAGDSLGLDLRFTPGETLTWMADGTTAGGSGGWSAAGQTWNDGSSVVAWNPAKTAIFAGSPGVVTVEGSATASKGLDFTVDGYTVDGGTLTLGGSSAAINELAVAADATATVAATLGGTNGLTKTGLGTLAIAGTATISGGVSIAGGTLAITAPATIGGGVSVSGGTLRVGDGGTAGSLAADVTVDVGTTVVFDRADAATFSGAISGAGTVRQQGAGTLVLSGTNTFSGPLVAAAGSVSVASDASLGAVPGAATPGRLVLADTTLATTSSFTLAATRGLALGPAGGSGSGTIDVAGGTTLSYAGAIANNGTAGTLVKAGPGTLALSGTSTYSGGTRLTAGRLEFASGGALGTGLVTLEGGTLAYTGPTGTVTRTMNVANQSSFDVPSGVQLTWSGRVQGTGTLPASDGKLVKTGGGTLLLNGNFDNQVNGIRVAEGTLVSQHGTNYFLLGYLRGTGGEPDGSPLEIAAAGTVRIDGIRQFQGAVTQYNTVTYSNTPVVLEGGQLVFVAPSSGSRDNTIGSLSFTAGGSLAIEANNRVDLNSLGGIATSGTGAATISGAGTLNIVKRAAGDTPTIDVALTAPLTISTPLTSTAFGNSTGGLGLTKTGLGTLTLGGANTYAGTTSILAGTLALGPTASLATAAIGVASGATFDVSALSGFTLGSGQRLGGAGGILGSLSFGSGSKLAFSTTDTLTVTSGTVSFFAGTPGSQFGIDDLIGLDATTPQGSYTLIAGLVDTTNLDNLGSGNAYALGDGRSAYFESGSLSVVVVPEPASVALAGLGLTACALARACRRRRAR